GDEEDLAALDRQRDPADGRLGRPPVAERQVVDLDERRRHLAVIVTGRSTASPSRLAASPWLSERERRPSESAIKTDDPIGTLPKVSPQTVSSTSSSPAPVAAPSTRANVRRIGRPVGRGPMALMRSSVVPANETLPKIITCVTWVSRRPSRTWASGRARRTRLSIGTTCPTDS